VTWVAWRVQRSQLVVTVGVLLALAMWLLVTGLAMGHSQTWKYWTDGDIYALYALPGLIGLSLGVPLVASESSLGTDRLVWTQSTTRMRWLATRLSVDGVIIVAFGAVLTLAAQWWTGAVTISALTQSGGFSGIRVQPEAFDVTGLVVVGYTLFAFFLGTAIGTFVRRPGWAFALGLPIFIAVRLYVQGLRNHLVAPAIFTSLLEKPSAAVTNGWQLNMALLPANRTSPPPGRTWRLWDASRAFDRCDAVVTTNAKAMHCAVLSHVHYVFQYQPESHYWPLQGAEFLIFLALGGVLLGITVIKVKHWRV
jgi:hypothetical protein